MPALADADQLNLAPASAKIEISIWNPPVPNLSAFPLDAFLSIGFSHHRTILSKVKETDARLFYIRKCAEERFSRDELEKSIACDDFHHQGTLPNNFIQTLPAAGLPFHCRRFCDIMRLSGGPAESRGPRQYPEGGKTHEKTVFPDPAPRLRIPPPAEA